MDYQDLKAQFEKTIQEAKARPKGKDEGYYLFRSSEKIVTSPEEIERMKKVMAELGVEASIAAVEEMPQYIYYCSDLDGVADILQNDDTLDELYTATRIEVTTPVTGFFFDEESGDPTHGHEVVLNSKDELAIYHETHNSHGHLVWLWWKDENGDKQVIQEGGVFDWSEFQ